MRHAKARHQFNRFTSWRDATLKSIARNLLIQQSIKTTKSKAKAAQPLLEQLITLAKTNTLFAKRQAYRILGDHKLVSLLFSDIGQRFANRVGGYTRIIGFGTRRGDSAELVIFELSEIKRKEKRKPAKKEEPKKEEAKTEKPVSGAEAQAEEKKTKTAVAVKEKPPETKKPTKKFLGGIRNIFKKERDSL
jgi:large subunit ribosomal protein L17